MQINSTNNKTSFGRIADIDKKLAPEFKRAIEDAATLINENSKDLRVDFFAGQTDKSRLVASVMVDTPTAKLGTDKPTYGVSESLNKLLSIQDPNNGEEVLKIVYDAFLTAKNKYFGVIK